MERHERGLTDFGELTDVGLRTAWPHAAHHFTPWLAENLDRLSEAIGVDLDAETTEAAVGQFAGDILATGPEGQSVLVENQLESSDHSHLGQIMTYLAGLDARIVVWVARDFAEPHLSAIQWLNRHTDDEFAFFAVRLRVVRIADSPLAPIFEIAAKPNRWERQVRHRSTGPRAELVKTYREFWTHYAQRYPEDGIRANHGLANFWVRPRNDAPTISMAFSFARGHVGIFLTPRGLSEEAMEEWVGERRHLISETLDGGKTHHRKRFDTDERAQWDAACDWLHEQLGRYRAIFEADPAEGPEDARDGP